MDFLLHVIVRDIEALSDFTMRRLLRVPGVRDVTSSIVLETVKRSPVIPLEELALRVAARRARSGRSITYPAMCDGCRLPARGSCVLRPFRLRMATRSVRQASEHAFDDEIAAVGSEIEDLRTLALQSRRDSSPRSCRCARNNRVRTVEALSSRHSAVSRTSSPSTTRSTNTMRKFSGSASMACSSNARACAASTNWSAVCASFAAGLPAYEFLTDFVDRHRVARSRRRDHQASLSATRVIHALKWPVGL
jgi:hypothetical protein